MEYWGLVMNMSNDQPCGMRTDGAIFIETRYIDDIIKKGAMCTTIHFTDPVNGKIHESPGIICYVKFIGLHVGEDGHIENSLPIICKIGSIDTFLKDSRASITLSTLGMTCNIYTDSEENPKDLIIVHWPYIIHGISLNVKQEGMRNVDVSRLSVIKFQIIVDFVPYIKEIVVLHSNGDGMRIRVDDVEPITDGIVACLPYSNGLLSKDYSLSVALSCNKVSNVDESKYDVNNDINTFTLEKNPEENFDFESCIVDNSHIKIAKVKALTIRKNNSLHIHNELEKNEMFPHIYAGWELVAKLGISDMSKVLIFDKNMKITRVVYIRAMHNSKPLKNIIFVPLDLSHNLQLDPEETYNDFKIGICDSIPKIPVATRIMLSIYNFNQNVHVPLLHKFFSLKKEFFLGLGDIVIIPTKDDDLLRDLRMLEVPAESILELCDSPVIAKVLELEISQNDSPKMFLNCAIFKTSVTNLQLKSTHTKIVPKHSLSYTLSNNNLSLLYSEYRLRSPFEELINVLRPYLSQKFPLILTPCTILLSSPNTLALKTWVLLLSDILGVYVEYLHPPDDSSDFSHVPFSAIKTAIEKTSLHQKSIIFLSNIYVPEDPNDDDAFSRTISYIVSSLKNVINAYNNTPHNSLPPIFILALDSSSLPPHLASSFLYNISEKSLTSSQSLEFVSNILKLYSLPHTLDIKRISHKTTGLSYNTLKNVLNCALKIALRRASSPVLCTQLPVLIDSDFDEAIFSNRKIDVSLSSSSNPVQNVSWDDVGGLSYPKKLVLDTISLILDHRNLFPKNLLKNPCMLFYGPPGTGKTFLARAIASNLGLNFLAIKGPELLSPYVGESEANLREVFASAINSSPCLIFFDEIDSISKARNFNSNSSGINDRLVSQLLTEIDKIASPHIKQNVFVIGATNRPDLIDSALLRSGRFTKMIYLGPCESLDHVLPIIKAITRNFSLHPDLIIDNVASKIPLPVTNADLYGICSQAYYTATRRVIQVLNTPQVPPLFPDTCESSSIDVVITESDFLHSLASFRPSIDIYSLNYYLELQNTYSPNLSQRSEYNNK